jgi:hypothetical protein
MDSVSQRNLSGVSGLVSAGRNVGADAGQGETLDRPVIAIFAATGAAAIRGDV